MAHAQSPSTSSLAAGTALPPSLGSIDSFQPDLFTGRAATSIPIAIPPGRRGLQPQLALSYSSSNPSGWVGVGWSLDMGFIERYTRLGPPTYDSDPSSAGSDTYSFMVQGVSSELVRLNDGSYRSKDEGAFMRFQYGTTRASQGWEVTDKSGTTYLFGLNPDARQDGLNGRIFRWALEKIIDTNGNFLSVTYDNFGQTQGPLYLKEINYTAHETNGTQDLAPTHKVAFTLDDVMDDPSNVHEIGRSHRSGVEVVVTKLLDQVTVTSSGAPVRRYDLEYSYNGWTARRRLFKVTQYGADDVTALPPMEFGYQNGALSTYTKMDDLEENEPSVPKWNVRGYQEDRGNENIHPCHPFLDVDYSDPMITETTSNGLPDMNVNFNSGSNGSLEVNFGHNHFVHAWTWVHNDTAVTIPSYKKVDGSNTIGCMWTEDNASGLQDRSNDANVQLQPGWTVIHIAAYNEISSDSINYTNDLVNDVDTMTPSQFTTPQLTGDMDADGITDLVVFRADTGKWEVALLIFVFPACRPVMARTLLCGFWINLH